MTIKQSICNQRGGVIDAGHVGMLYDCESHQCQAGGFSFKQSKWHGTTATSLESSRLNPFPTDPRAITALSNASLLAIRCGP